MFMLCDADDGLLYRNTSGKPAAHPSTPGTDRLGLNDFG